MVIIEHVLLLTCQGKTLTSLFVMLSMFQILTSNSYTSIYLSIYMYIYIYIYIYKFIKEYTYQLINFSHFTILIFYSSSYIYIYIYRERERHTHIYIYVYICKQ